jgi:hypothetical protein
MGTDSRDTVAALVEPCTSTSLTEGRCDIVGYNVLSCVENTNGGRRVLFNPPQAMNNASKALVGAKVCRRDRRVVERATTPCVLLIVQI